MPDLISQLSNLIDAEDGYRIIDDELIDEVKTILDESNVISTTNNSTERYHVSYSYDIIDFLEKNKDRIVVAISW